MRHLTEDEVESFVGGELGSAGSGQVLRHVADCGACWARLEARIAELFRVEVDDSRPVEEHEEDAYDAAIGRAFSRVLRGESYRQHQRERLAKLLEAAHACPKGLLGLPLQQRRSVRGPFYVEALLQLSYEARFRDPQQMWTLALGATSAARGLDPGTYGKGLVADLCARAYVELANACRVNDQFDDADNALARAERAMAEGTGDPLLPARLGDVTASLRTAQRRLPEAIDILDHVYRIYLQLGERHLAGRALISKGISTGYLGETHETVEILRQGLALLDPEHDPQLAAIGQQCLLDALVDCGEYREAGKLLLESGLRQIFAGEPRILLKLRWVEGKILAGLGKLERAERALDKVQAEFRRLEERYEAALVGLDRTAVLLQQRRAAEARALAKETLAVFQHLRVHREAVRAVACLNEACQLEQATPGLVQDVVRFLGQLEWQPHLRFAP